MQNIAIFEKLRALLARKEAAPPTERGAAELIPFARKRAPRTIAFALQGGGAHGAFTWGVLDRALEEGLAHRGDQRHERGRDQRGGLGIGACARRRALRAHAARRVLACPGAGRAA